MAMWRRDKRPASDPAFEHFTQEQAERFRAMAGEAFAAAGIETVVHEQHLQAGDGRQFGLFNLAATCGQATEGEQAWPALMAEHVAAITRSIEGDKVEGMSLEEVLPLVYLRVIGTSTLSPQWAEGFGYARHLGGDLIEVLAVDLPDIVTTLGDGDVQRLGEDALRAAALRNLLSLRVDSHEVTGDELDGAAIHLVEGESFFTASKLLVLEDLLSGTLGERELPHGLVVSVPVRHVLVFHPIADLSVVDAVQRMAGFTAETCRSGAGSVSPFVYWWKNGQLTPLTWVTDDGELQVVAGGEFTDMLNQLAPKAETTA